MTKIDSTMLADMHARRRSGEKIDAIASRYNIKPMTAYQRLRRAFGTSEVLPGPNNDNHPDRITKMSPRNGGCSTLSGMMPVTLPTIATMETAPVALSSREALLAVAANDNRQPMQVAA